ncbi:MAG: hypothetical protein HN593_03230 [Lentimicrobiaceae bacterium]|nr:hypothetical protein [Lentimicrobiaceae bacterium]
MKKGGVGGKIDSYSDGKIEIENALFKGLNDKGTPVTVIRENLIFGLKSPWYFGYIFYRLSNRLPIYIFEDSQIVNTNPVFVEDVIQAFLECMSNKISHGKIYNMGGIELVSELDMIRLCEKISSIKATVYKLPTLSNALPEQRGVGFHEWGYYNLSTAAITQELNYKLTPLEVSVKEIYKELMFSPSLMKEYYFRGETIILKNYPLTFQAHLVILILKILRWIMGFWR